MTNAASVMIATYAKRVAKAFSPWQQHARTAVERKLDALLRRGAAGRSGVVRKTHARSPGRPTPRAPFAATLDPAGIGTMSRTALTAAMRRYCE